jgi:hypothetical protein
LASPMLPVQPTAASEAARAAPRTDLPGFGGRIITLVPPAGGVGLLPRSASTAKSLRARPHTEHVSRTLCVLPRVIGFVATILLY